MRKSFLVLFLSFLFLNVQAQRVLKGIVLDQSKNPIFAANVYLKSQANKGVITDFDGSFSLEVSSDFLKTDDLVISFIAYKQKSISLETLDLSKSLEIILEEDVKTLREVVVKAEDPISEQFSVVKMNKMDIYLNPSSQGDPLKAISILPASTTTDETANPSLRGSSPDRSRVILNEVPIYKPVRSSQLNNQGFFSLFNPEMIKNQYVYASNPPLTYGNTSAGLVDMTTNTNLEKNNLNLSLGLGSTGFFFSKKLKEHTTFIQSYGNYQFSDAFTGIQKDKLPVIDKFKTVDAGINFHHKFNKKISVNSFYYFLDEKFNGSALAYKDRNKFSSKNKRFFTVNNLKLKFTKSHLSFNNKINLANSVYQGQGLNASNKQKSVYSSLNYKYFPLDKLDLQMGISHDFQANDFQDNIFARNPNTNLDSLVYVSDTSVFNHNLEAYAYLRYDLAEKWILSSGLRTNLPTDKQSSYFSSQIGLKYKLSSSQSFLLSAGKYHNYSVPNYFNKHSNLLSSNQIALDYSQEWNNTLIKTAVYYKNEKGGQSIDRDFVSDRVTTLGFELYLEQYLHKNIKFTFSNAYINQEASIGTEIYAGDKDFDFLIKSTISYANPKLFTLSMNYMSNSGRNYTSVLEGTLNSNTNIYAPVFSHKINQELYTAYHRLDLSLSKYIKLESSALIFYASVNNLLNIKNQRELIYSSDYTASTFDHYSLRTVYIGAVWQLDF